MKTSTKSTALSAAYIVAVVSVCVAVGYTLNHFYPLNPETAAPAIYDDGSLIDATGPISYEEDGDPAELGYRLVALAAGGSFTTEQIEQISELVAGLFEEVRNLGIGVETLEAQIDRLEQEILD